MLLIVLAAIAQLNELGNESVLSSTQFMMLPAEDIEKKDKENKTS